MLHLKNIYLTVDMDLPETGYLGSRFDQMGKITQIVDVHGNSFLTQERLQGIDNSLVGKGLYDEFGIDKPIGYDECEVGEYFPKLGVGMLKKFSNEPYDFFFPYERLPFNVLVNQISDDVVVFECESNIGNYPFALKKTFSLVDNTLCIEYLLENRGSQVISTNHYVHNFISINNAGVDKSIKLLFNKNISSHSASNGLNPNGVVFFDKQTPKDLSFRDVPPSDFFFDCLIEDASQCSAWILQNDAGVSISEKVDFKPCKVNLWGASHVVSPELFLDIELKPSAALRWERTYHFSMKNVD